MRHPVWRLAVQGDADVDAGEDPQFGSDGGAVGGYAVDLPLANRLWSR